MPSVTDMCEQKGIALAGTLLVDRINEIGAYPASGELTKILGVSRAVGGCVMNTGIDIRRFDPSIPVKAIGRIGRDSDGELLMAELEKNGIDTEGVIYGEQTTSFTDVMSIAGGQRTFFTYPGASADFCYSDVRFDGLDASMLHLGYFLLLDRIDAGDGKAILREAQSRGIRTSIDLVSENSDRYALVAECLEFVDNLIINEYEAGRIAGIDPTEENLEQIARRLKEMGVSERVIIHMPEVGVCLSDDGFTVLPSPKLPDGFIKGKTGAGDAFCAGALIGIYRGVSDEEILRLATKAAVASLSSSDAVSGMVSESEIDDMLSKIKVKI